jgi:hypothetical protein
VSGWELSPLCAYVYPSTLALRTASSWLPSREETGCSRSLLQLSPLIVCTIPKAAWEGSSVDDQQCRDLCTYYSQKLFPFLPLVKDSIKFCLFPELCTFIVVRRLTVVACQGCQVTNHSGPGPCFSGGRKPFQYNPCLPFFLTGSILRHPYFL